MENPHLDQSNPANHLSTTHSLLKGLHQIKASHASLYFRVCYLSLLEILIDSPTFAAMANDSIQVVLVSGKGAQISASTDHPLRYVRLQAQNVLQTSLGVLLDSTGRILDERKTVGGDSLTLQVRQTRLASSKNSFAAIMGDGSVETWYGHSRRVQEQLSNVRHIQATDSAFAAILDDGSVITWGRPDFGGDSSRVREQLRKVQQIQAARWAFAAILDDGSVVTWGHPQYSVDGRTVQTQLRNVQHIQATDSAFAVILDNGSVVTWGSPENGAIWW